MINTIMDIESHRLPTDILYNYITKLCKKEHKQEIEAIFYLESNIIDILSKTRNNSSSLIRLKWWYDQVRYSKTKKLEFYGKKGEIFTEYLHKRSNQEIDALCNYIESFEPMINRRIMNNIYDEYLANLSEKYFEILKNYFQINEKTILMLCYARFLDHVPIYLSSNWQIFANKKDFDELFKLVTKNQDNQANFIYKSSKYIINNYQKSYDFSTDYLQNIDKFPYLNLGFVKLKLAIYSLYCNLD